LNREQLKQKLSQRKTELEAKTNQVNQQLTQTKKDNDLQLETHKKKIEMRISQAEQRLNGLDKSIIELQAVIDIKYLKGNNPF